MANDKFENVTTDADRPGCDRPGCSVHVPKGTTLRKSTTGNVFHNLDECNGLDDKSLGAWAKAQVTEGKVNAADVLAWAITKGIRKPIGTKSTKGTTVATMDAAQLLAAMTDDQRNALLAALVAQVPAAAPNTPVVSKAKRN